ncbi:hypothetical protein JAAARDRAFT_210430 [Jaapia argillacea MUCL 33604]|uniref:Uncharacterized protein n=1 Tax=Jaapia argillacea MUCL 33604 TaxID=933084 RepID=A0A067PNA7_9AGAM|nr:hypothetical protein JAAARDRAFT_210430 [Jaapia argillacea MUCL 33604]
MAGKSNPALCDVCQQKPKHGQHPYCGKFCAAQATAKGSAPKPTPMCINCNQKPKFGNFDYCGKRCAAMANGAGGSAPAPQMARSGANGGTKGGAPRATAAPKAPIAPQQSFAPPPVNTQYQPPQQQWQAPTYPTQQYQSSAQPAPPNFGPSAGFSTSYDAPANFGQPTGYSPAAAYQSVDDVYPPSPASSSPASPGFGATALGIMGMGPSAAAPQFQGPQMGSRNPFADPNAAPFATAQPTFAPAPKNTTAYQPRQQGLPMCRIPGCERQVYVDGAQTSEYCSQRHREDAVAMGLVEVCIMCNRMPQGGKDHFCSRTCREEALRKPRPV